VFRRGPYEFYRNRVLDAAAAQAKVEGITRAEVGTAECPLPGLAVEEPVA
jgi:hypothetical protein